MADLKKDMSFLPERDSNFKDLQDSIAISGFNNVVNKNVSPIKRLVWLFLLIGMSTVMVWQIVERSKTYFSNPLAVNIELKYETHVRFPVIVICNLNPATISSIYGALPSDIITDGYADNNHFRFYYDYFGAIKMLKLGQNETAINKYLEKLKHDYKWFYEPDSIPYELYHKDRKNKETAHDLNRMLGRCSWQDKPCTVADFTRVYNAHTSEVCYAFNANKSKFTEIPGRKGGLDLWMDVQQYEYMDPTVFGAGLKVAILDSKEDAAAAIDDMFYQVSAGMSVSIPIKRMNYSEVTPPIGICNETNTLLACMDECQTRVIIQVCGCKLIWMEGSAPNCTVEQEIGCVKIAYHNLASIIKNNSTCNCKPGCFRTEYQTSISVSPMSDYMASSIMLLSPPPVGLEIKGRIHDWSYLERRNRSLTDTLWTIGRQLKEIHVSKQPQIFNDLSSYINILQQFENLDNISHTKNTNNSIIGDKDIGHEIRNISEQYLEVTESLSNSFFSVLVVKADPNGDNIVDDFYVRCANDILRRNGTNMENFYLKITDKIDAIMTSLESLDNLSYALTLWTANITKDSLINYGMLGMTQGIKSYALIEQFHDLKRNSSQIYKMYRDVYRTVHSDSALLHTRDWGKIGESEDFYKHNIIQFTIFYESLSTTWIKQFETDSLTSLICDLGGNIGLWLGGSILTVFEVLDLALVIIKTTSKQRCILPMTVNHDRS